MDGLAQFLLKPKDTNISFSTSWNEKLLTRNIGKTGSSAFMANKRWKRNEKKNGQFLGRRVRTWHTLECVADEIWPRLLTSAKQRRVPCSGSPKDSSAFQISFQPDYHGKYSILGTQVGSPEWGFRCCFEEWLNHNSVSSIAQARHILGVLKTSFIFRKMSYREQVNYFEESACPKGRHC